ncbi:MAG: TauD/TfdA family dioxygenase, partial [Alphaproteobacteria bacterium]
MKPTPVAGPSAWTGAEMRARGDWLVRLGDDDVAEVEAALAAALAGGRDIAMLSAADFPLPTLGPRLLAWRGEILDGRGFVQLRGLPVHRWTMREAATAWFGLGAHLGRAVTQNARGHVLGHVRDLGLDAADPNVRVYQTTARQNFHTDSCDIVGLLCLRTARSGGLSCIVSSAAIHNAMLATRPDLVAELHKPMAIDRRGERAADGRGWWTAAVFNRDGPLLTTIYTRRYIESAQRHPDAPPGFTSRDVADRGFSTLPRTQAMKRANERIADWLADGL